MPLTSMGSTKRAMGFGLSLALAASLVGGAAIAQDDDKVSILSTQFEPVAEREVMNNVILVGAPETEYLTVSSTGQFFDQIELDQSSGGGDLDALGALHGEFAALAKDDVLLDLSDIAAELGISPALLEVGKLGTDKQLYIPWMQATYVMAANNDSLQYLPEGADLMHLSWDEWRDWGKNIFEATGERRLGLPLKGGPGAALHHRLLQGYLYPSFTGAVNTEFATDKGIAMWDWLKDSWQYINPNATWSEMQLPLQNREVDVAWDHTARLIEALRAEPEQFTAFPSPAGPEGRGFMPVIVGLGILKTADNPDGAKELLKHYLKPETQGLVLEEKGWFPVLAGEVPADIDAGLKLQMDAVAAQASADDALPALLPIGLGAQGAAYNFAFQDSMNWVLVQDIDAADYLRNASGPVLQTVLDRAGAPCWQPDPDSGDETCQVGGLE